MISEEDASNANIHLSGYNIRNGRNGRLESLLLGVELIKLTSTLIIRTF